MRTKFFVTRKAIIAGKPVYELGQRIPISKTNPQASIEKLEQSLRDALCFVRVNDGYYRVEVWRERGGKHQLFDKRIILSAWSPSQDGTWDCWEASDEGTRATDDDIVQAICTIFDKQEQQPVGVH